MLSVGAAVLAAATLAGNAVPGVSPAATGHPNYAKAMKVLATLDASVTKSGTDGISVQNALLAIENTPGLSGDTELAVNNLLVEVSQFFSNGLAQIQAAENVVWQGLRSKASRSRLQASAKSLGSAIATGASIVGQLQSGFQAIATALGSTGTTAQQAVSSLTADVQRISASQVVLVATLAK